MLLAVWFFWICWSRFKIRKAEHGSATTWSGCSRAKPIALPASVLNKKHAERALDFARTDCGIESANVDKISSKQFISSYGINSLVNNYKRTFRIRRHKRGLSFEWIGGCYTKAILKFTKLNKWSQHRGAVVQGRSLLPYRLRYIENLIAVSLKIFFTHAKNV
jgi:hypothetical protein